VVHPHTERPKESRHYVARSEAGSYPQGYISRVEAAQACANAGKRLCTFREWRRACQGSKGARYPYGFRAENGRCNVGKPHLLPKLFGSDSRLWKYEQFNSPALLAEPGHLARAGAYERCVGESGVYDLRGNLHEWVAGTVTDELMATLEKDDVERDKQPWTVGNGIFVGGFFSTTNEHGPGCLFTTVAHEPRYHDYSTGFRCCQDAPAAESKKTTKPKPAPGGKSPKSKSG
jgi:formylglycine-generating enzyme required for sulfatase activity